MTKEEIIALTNQYNQEIAALLGRELIPITVDPDWNAFRTHGLCTKFRDGSRVTRIRISNSLIHDKDIKEVILHELCHVYAPIWERHGEQWQSIADLVGMHYGIKITRCNEREHSGLKERVVCTLTCPECGCVSTLYRRTSAYYHPEKFQCKHCGRKTLGKLIFKKYK